MAGKVIFALTETQAATLGAIALGARVIAESPAVKALHKKELVSIATANGEISLTDLGASAVDLCARLTISKLNGRRR